MPFVSNYVLDNLGKLHLKVLHHFKDIAEATCCVGHDGCTSCFVLNVYYICIL